MIKHLSKISGVAAFAVIASSASAEVKINENLSLDGYAIGTFGITEGTAAQNDTFLDSADKMQDAVKVALNGKYGDFTGKVSLLYVPESADDNAGLLDAYVTYKTGDVAITVGKFNNFLGYESFDSPNNAFILFGPADNVGYVASYATGSKVEYITESFSVGASARDSLQAEGFFRGDGEFKDDMGYEAYFLYTGIEKLTVFAGMGFENTDGAVDDLYTYNVWAAYALTDKLTLVGSYASTTNGTSTGIDYSYTFLTTYAVNDALSVAGRFGEAKRFDGSSYFEFGTAATYTLTENFAVKGEVSKRDLVHSGDTFFYAVQGIFKF